MANYGVVYGAESSIVRRIVVSDDPDYDYSQHVQEGEAFVLADTKNGMDVFAARAAVQAATRAVAADGLTALVDASGLVTAMIMADPVLDTVEGRDLIPAYDGVAIGQTYDRNTGTFWVPETIIPAGVGPAGPYPETVVPAHPVPKP